MRSSIKYCGVGCYKHLLLDRGSNSRRLNPSESSREKSGRFCFWKEEVAACDI